MKNTKTKKHNERHYYLVPKRGGKYLLPITGLILALSIPGAYYVGNTLTNRALSYFNKPEPVVIEVEPTKPYDIICKATRGENCDTIYNLCTKESGKFINTDEEKCQRYAVGKNTNGTFDFSWLQINDVHIIGRSKGKGTITMECVYDLPCVAKWANEQIKKGNGHIWSAWDKI
jgi:hypothetical protein